MAGRFSFSVPERRQPSDPWFRVGQVDVTTTVLVAGMWALSMVVWAIDPEALYSLVLFGDDSGFSSVRDAQLWRLVTWPFYNEPDIWTVISIAIFWYFGRELEATVGRARFAILLLLLTIVPGLAAVAVDTTLFGLELVQLGVFLVFVFENPFVRFFFGVPGWVIGAVIVGIQFLQYLGNRREDLILVLVATIVTAGLCARAMGLAESLPWIPALPIPGLSSRSRRRKAPKQPRRSSPGRGGGDVVAGPWSSAGRAGPGSTAPLPQPPSSPDAISDQAELDDLLDKISAQGMDGLTAAEKQRLNELSRRLRNKK